MEDSRYSEVMHTPHATWLGRRGSWLSDNQIDSSRKNSQFSVETANSSLDGDEDRQRDALSSIWRDLVGLSGLPTPTYSTWEEALKDLDATLKGILNGTIPLIHSTLVGHAICVAAGYPAGSCATLEKVRHHHILVRDLGVLMHTLSMRNRPLDGVAEAYHLNLHAFVALTGLPHPLKEREFVIKTTQGTVVVDELGRTLRTTHERTHVVQAGGSVDYEHLQTLASAQIHDPLAACQVIDIVDLAPVYSQGCALIALQHDPGLLHLLTFFLEARIRLHNHVLNGGDPKSVEVAVDCLRRLSYYSPAKLENVNQSASQDAIFTRQGTLRAGTPEVLVEHMTRHDQRPDSLHQFLLTFSAFMTEYELLDLLWKRYTLEPSESLSPAILDEWKSRVLLPIRARVIAVLKLWMTSYWLDPGYPREDRPLVTAKLREFADYAQNFVLSSLVAQLLDAPPPIVTVPPAPLSNFNFMSLTPEALAAYFTGIKVQTFRSVTHQCFLWKQIGRIPEDASTPLNRYIKHWNLETNWVSAQIMSVEDVTQRALAIEFFIDVAYELRRLQNFSSLMAFISAFSSAGLYRLKRTWALVGNVHNERLDSLTKLMNSSCNFNTYREELWHIKGPCVPFTGLSLMDLQYTYDGNDDFINVEQKLINFSKWSVIAGIIDNALRFRQFEYKLNTDPAVLAAFGLSLPLAPPLNDQYDRSLEIEPRLQRINSRSTVASQGSGRSGISHLSRMSEN